MSTACTVVGVSLFFVSRSLGPERVGCLDAIYNIYSCCFELCNRRIIGIPRNYRRCRSSDTKRTSVVSASKVDRCQRRLMSISVFLYVRNNRQQWWIVAKSPALAPTVHGWNRCLFWRPHFLLFLFIFFINRRCSANSAFFGHPICSAENSTLAVHLVKICGGGGGS